MQFAGTLHKPFPRAAAEPAAHVRQWATAAAPRSLCLGTAVYFKAACFWLTASVIFACIARDVGFLCPQASVFSSAYPRRAHRRGFGAHSFILRGAIAWSKPASVCPANRSVSAAIFFLLSKTPKNSPDCWRFCTCAETVWAAIINTKRGLINAGLSACRTDLAHSAPVKMEQRRFWRQAQGFALANHENAH